MMQLQVIGCNVCFPAYLVEQFGEHAGYVWMGLQNGRDMSSICYDLRMAGRRQGMYNRGRKGANGKRIREYVGIPEGMDAFEWIEDASEWLETVIDTLTVNHRRIISMFRQGYTQAEIAETEGVSQPTISVRLVNAIEELRSLAVLHEVKA